MLRKREFATHFFKEYLPENIVSQLDWRRFKVSKETFITSEFEDRFSDVIYETYIKGNPAFIYILLEHQSTVDPWMPLRFLRYMIELWELYIA